MITKYGGSDLNRVPTVIGVVRVVSTATDQTLPANSGVSLPCKEVYINSAISNLAISYVSFASAYVSRACPVAIVSSVAIHSTLGIPAPLRFAVDDLSKLWFYIITSGDEVLVMYRC